MMKLALEMDGRLVAAYYLTSAIGGAMPVAESIAVKLMVDNLGKWQSGGTIGLTVLMTIIALRFLAPLTEAVAYWGVNTSYLDYLFRYKLQNRVSLKFYDKLAHLDIGYFEDPKSQDLITKTRDTMQWRVPDTLRMFGYLFRNLVLVTSAFLVLLRF